MLGSKEMQKPLGLQVNICILAEYGLIRCYATTQDATWVAVIFFFAAQVLLVFYSSIRSLVEYNCG